MSLAQPPSGLAAAEFHHELTHLRKDWKWVLALGIVLIVCGIVALAYPLATSVAAVIVLGAASAVAGIGLIIFSFWAGKWSATLLQVLLGILYLVVGVVIMDRPVAGAVTLTAFIAAFFIMAGTFRMVAALMLRFPQWGWVLLNGIVTALLGVFIYRHFSDAALTAVGVLVGIDMVFSGWTWIMMALALRRLPL